MRAKTVTQALDASCDIPEFDRLNSQLIEGRQLIDDIVLKKYLTRLTELDIVPLAENLKRIDAIRLFKINEMVYQNGEYSTYKFASVFNSVQNLNCGVFIIVDSDGKKTSFYMGVRSLDDKRTTKSLKDTLRNALCGQFPGVKAVDLLDPAAEEFLTNVLGKNIAAVSCVAQNKDEKFNDNEKFIQGLEKFVLAMQKQKYTAVVLAKSTPKTILEEMRKAYEVVYSQLSPFTNNVITYGHNEAISISNALSIGNSKNTTFGESQTTTSGTSKTITNGYSVTDTKGINKTKTIGFTQNASIIVASVGISESFSNTISESKSIGTSKSEAIGENKSKSVGHNNSNSLGTSQNATKTEGLTTGRSDTLQLTMQNKTLINTLERIDLQLKRIEEFESLGMWECAAYFLSDSQEATEMAAGTYKALMKGEKSGVETSAINFWGRTNSGQIPLLREYITNFIHPVFEYRSNSVTVPVTAASLVSGNELAIQMGLPRKSVCGFPVIEHADFAKEIIMYNQQVPKNSFILGKVFSMGIESDTEVRLDRDSLTMHTFITGATGSGKSNAVFEILSQLRNVYNIPFLIIEPAKGEYKNIFGQFNDVAVYGTNPKKSSLLRLNPFRFPTDIHVLEHLDRLAELFNVCWPMYAAMPAILKDAMEKAYIEAGWDISTSENLKGEIFPNFSDLLEQIERVINESKYSADSKGDYSGALCTRVRSLTNGLNGLIFCNEDLTDEKLFDKSVIIDLSRVGSSETKSLIMGLLVMKLNEYRMTSGKVNSPLAHITVLEEAHNLLKRTSTEQASEGSNLLGKSVEMLANSIAEMRTYGEGFIIADQAPGLLDMSVVRNTNTKIILRLPEQSDRELVGLAASLNNEQIIELSKLERGVAAIYQNDWVEPVLTKINKCSIVEKNFNGKSDVILHDVHNIKQQIVYFLIQGRVNERLKFNIDEIELNLKSLSLSSRHREFIEELIFEYREDRTLSIWDSVNFSKLSRRLSDFLEIRSKVENIVLTSTDYTELTTQMLKVVKSFIPNPSENLAFSLMQCFMKDLSMGQDENDKREKIYMSWVDYVKERSAMI